MNTLRVVLVEDETLLAQMLEAWLVRQQCVMVGCAAEAEAGLALCLAHRPNLVLLDVMLPGMDGLRLAERLKQQLPDLKILMLTSRFDPFCLYRVHQLGLAGYVDKASPPAVLREALQAVARGERFFSPRFLELWQEQRNDPVAFFKILSDREIEVLRLVAQGRGPQEIAAELGITYQTVRTHQKHIRAKLNLHTNAAISRYALQLGLYP